MEPEVGHEDSNGKERFSDAQQVVSRDVGPVDVPVAVQVVIDDCRPPTSKEEDLGGDILENPFGDVALSQFQRSQSIKKKNSGKDNCRQVVPMVHSVFFSLVWVLNNKKERYKVEYLGPVIHHHSQQFQVNL